MGRGKKGDENREEEIERERERERERTYAGKRIQTAAGRTTVVCMGGACARSVALLKRTKISI